MDIICSIQRVRNSYNSKIIKSQREETTWKNQTQMENDSEHE